MKNRNFVRITFLRIWNQLVTILKSIFSITKKTYQYLKNTMLYKIIAWILKKIWVILEILDLPFAWMKDVWYDFLHKLKERCKIAYGIVIVLAFIITYILQVLQTFSDRISDSGQHATELVDRAKKLNGKQAY